MARILFFLPIVFILWSCAPYKPGEPKSGFCNELNSELIFSGATSITRNAEIQAAEQPLAQQNYDRRCAR